MPEQLRKTGRFCFSESPIPNPQSRPPTHDPPPPPRRHHGRQRPMGGAAAAAADDRPPRRCAHGQPVNRLLPRTRDLRDHRSEEHTSEIQSLMRNSYAGFCLKKKINKYTNQEDMKDVIQNQTADK